MATASVTYDYSPHHLRLQDYIISSLGKQYMDSRPLDLKAARPC